MTCSRRAGHHGRSSRTTAPIHLNKAVGSHKVILAAAQRAIAHNWVIAEKDLGL